MLLKHYLLPKTLVKSRQFYLVVKRFLRKTHLVLSDNDLSQNPYPKGKVTVVKRKFVDKKYTSVLETKPASQVMKSLNWEFKCLFGPVQSSKTNLKDLDNIESDEIIQHETLIPIVEPKDQINEQEIDLTSVLTFPLVNKLAYSTARINELNHLRKKLELLSKQSMVPSVSQILQTTMPKERVDILDRWKQNMISQLGEEGFERYQKELLATGISLHHSISSFLISTPESELQIKEENIGHWKSLKHIFPNIKDVKLIEEFVTHPFLSYRGVVDCFAKYKNNLVVIDWKASKKSKAQLKDTYDDPLQIAAYAGALNFDPKFQYLASKGLIIIAYENGMPATAHLLSDSTLKDYWNEWLMRLKQYWEIKRSEIESSKFVVNSEK